MRYEAQSHHTRSAAHQRGGPESRSNDAPLLEMGEGGQPGVRAIHAHIAAMCVSSRGVEIPREGVQALG